MCYKYARLWVDLFEQYPVLADQNKELYLKGIHNLLLALFNLRSYKRYVEVLTELEQNPPNEKDSENVILLYQQYVFTNQINRYYLEGNFTKGLELVPKIEAFVKSSEDKLDVHRAMVFYYKIACLYFGNGENKKAIYYLNLIIQMKAQSIREDIQSFARILNLIAHFELGNDDLLEYQVKSVYRYLSNMGDLQGVQKEILTFIRQLPTVNPSDLRKVFKQLLSKLVKLSQSKFEKRPFMYLDIISWLECKIENKTVSEVIREKFEKEIKTGEKQYFPGAN
jgi:tetratricopeptide (TPR) repeat protein